MNTVNFATMNNYITNPNSIKTLSNILNNTSTVTQTYNKSTDFDTIWGVRFHIQRVDGQGCYGHTRWHYVSYVNIPKNLPAKVRFRPVVNLRQNSDKTRTTKVQIALFKTPSADASSWPFGDYRKDERKWISSVQSVTCPSKTVVSVAFDDPMTGYTNNPNDEAAYVAIGIEDATNIGYTVNFTFAIDFINVG
jgi:hypothetical protein